MTATHDADILTLAVLENERHAHAVLADYLDERGDAALAQQARGADRDQALRLDVALGSVSARWGLLLACDCAEHIFPWLRRQPAERYSARGLLLGSIDAVRDHLDDVPTEDSLAWARRTLADALTLQGVCFPLAEAVQIFEQRETGSQSNAPTPSAGELHTKLCEAARGARKQRIRNHLKPEENLQAQQHELSWQIENAIRRLNTRLGRRTRRPRNAGIAR